MAGFTEVIYSGSQPFDNVDQTGFLRTVIPETITELISSGDEPSFGYGSEDTLDVEANGAVQPTTATYTEPAGPPTPNGKAGEADGQYYGDPTVVGATSNGREIVRYDVYDLNYPVTSVEVVYTGDGTDDDGSSNSSLTLSEGTGPTFEALKGAALSSLIDSSGPLFLDASGSTGDNVIAATPGGGEYYLGSGNDTFIGGEAEEAVYTGKGNDKLTLGSVSDYVDLAPGGNDTVNGGNGAYNIEDGTDVTTLGVYSINVGNGDDTVYLADGKNTIVVGNGTNVITLEGGTSTVTLGSGDNTVGLESDANATIEGGTGANTYVLYGLDETHDGIPLAAASPPSVTIDGSHSVPTAGTKQDTLFLKGSPSDYAFTVEGTSWDNASTTIMPVSMSSSESGLPGSIETNQVADVTFDEAYITNEVNGGQPTNLDLEMAYLAADAYEDSGPATGGSASTDREDTEQDAEARGWMPVSAMELGISPYGSNGSQPYSFVDGIYTDQGPVNNENALVMYGIVNGTPTLTVTFRGTDEKPGDFVDYASFSGTLQQKFGTLLNALGTFASKNGIEKIIFGGHSLGAGLAQAAMAYPATQGSSATSFYGAQTAAYVVANPGAEQGTLSTLNGPLQNISHLNDLVGATIPKVSGTATSTLGQLLIGTITAIRDPVLVPLALGVVNEIAKYQAGGNIFIDSPLTGYGPNNFGAAHGLGYSAYDPPGSYTTDIENLVTDAGNAIASGFAQTQVGFDLINGFPYTGAPVTFLPGAPSGGQTLDPSAEDDYVFAAPDDRIYLSAPTIMNWAATGGQHVIDAGKGDTSLDLPFAPSVVSYVQLASGGYSLDLERSGQLQQVATVYGIDPSHVHFATEETAYEAEDGYIAGATISRASGGASGNSTTTDADGAFLVPSGIGNLVLTGGIDTATGQAFAGQLEAPADATVISPLTTLVADLEKQGESSATASSAVMSALGLPSGIAIDQFDPEGAFLGGDPLGEITYLIGSAVENTVDGIADAVADAGGQFGASSSDAYGRLAAAVSAGSGSYLDTPDALAGAIEGIAGDEGVVLSTVAAGAAAQAIITSDQALTTPDANSTAAEIIAATGAQQAALGTTVASAVSGASPTPEGAGAGGGSGSSAGGTGPSGGPAPVETVPGPAGNAPVATPPQPASPDAAGGSNGADGGAAAIGTAPADQVTFAPSSSYAKGVFTLTGHVSTASGIASVDVSATVDGVRSDLGTATVNADGTFDFSDIIGAHSQSFITASLTDSVGGTAVGTASYSLMGRPGRRAEQDTYSGDGSAMLVSTRFDADGRRDIDVEAPGQTVDLQPYDIALNHRQDGTTFVFSPGDGLDVIAGFKLGGAGHDTLSLPSADFHNLGELLRDTGDVNGSAFITDPKTGDAIRLVGVTTAELKAHPKDFAFGA